MFPIKYIDNNLVWNKDNEVFAYYELIPYNYSFLSAEQKFIVHDSFRQLIAQSREGKIHALQIATESSIRSMQEQSKKLVTGKLKEVACQKIDEQTEALVSMIGDNQVDYRFFLGFKLMVTEEQLNLKNIKKSVWLTFTEFLHEVNHTLMNDFVSMPNDEINRYMKMEKLLENKISRRFKVRRLEINDFGYLMEHLYGRDGIAYEDYEYQLPKKKLNKETLIKYYDLIRPTRCAIEESQRYLRLEHEDKESYVSYFTVNAIVGELDFPSSEIFYFQQQQFTFPVDTSMNVEIVENRKALTTVRNKKKELKDLDNHAYQAGSETSSNVVYRETVGRFLCSLPVNIGYIVAGIDSEKRGFHDLLCDTRVVYQKKIKAWMAQPGTVVPECEKPNVEEQKQQTSEGELSKTQENVQMKESGIRELKKTENTQSSVVEKLGKPVYNGYRLVENKSDISGSARLCLGCH